MTNASDQGRRRALTVLGVAVAVLILAVVVLGATTGLAVTTEETTDHQAGAIALDLGTAGDVEIMATDGDTIFVETRTRAVWRTVTTEERVEGDTLVIESDCGGWWMVLGDCRVDYLIRVPAATEVSGSASNGEVDVSGLTSPIDLSTTNGAMTITDVEAPVRLRTTNGDVEIEGVTGNLTVETSNGAVRVRDTSAPERIDVTTSNGVVEMSNTVGNLILEASNGHIDIRQASASRVMAETTNAPMTITLDTSPEQIATTSRNGDIVIALPPDSPAYAIDVRTRNGTTSVEDVVDDPDAPFTIDVETTNGDISIQG